MHMYALVARDVEPLKLRLKTAQATLSKKEDQLDQAKAKLAEVERVVNELNEQFTSNTREKEELTQTAEELKIKLERAEKLVSG